MLFDDDEQLEVRHVVSLAHHDISIYSGEEPTPEGELFIKRNAICLSRKKDGSELGPDTQLSKPFFLFSENCSAKEDFYFALLRNQEHSLQSENAFPMPLHFEMKNIISLVQRLHASEDHMQTRWLNALLGRIFLGVYKTKDVENFIREKLAKKISRVKRPSFLSNIAIRAIDTGESAPYITNPRLRDLTVEGECGVEADVRYTGNFRLEVAATARIDLGTRFKAREVNLVLAVVIRKVEGHLMFKIKPPPSNRIWFSFQQMPKMEMTIEPIVSSRQITYTVILRQIENRIKEVIAETLVLPFWDDVPFFRTEHKKWRGGVFDDPTVEPSPDLDLAPIGHGGDAEEAEPLEPNHIMQESELPPIEKSHSVPVIEKADSLPATGLFGRRLTNKGKIGSASSASASSTSIETKNDVPLRPARSASFVNAAAPVVGTDATNADIFKPSSSPPNESLAATAMATLSAKSQTVAPAPNPAPLLFKPYITSKSSNPSSGSSREATDTEKENEESARAPRRNTASSTGSHEDSGAPNSPSLSAQGSVRSQTGSIARGLFGRKEIPSPTPPAPASPGINDPQKRTALAAVTNAAVSAKRWGLNAIQRHNEAVAARNGGPATNESPLDLNQPMGRGRPLPPPGMPLPMPDKKTKTAPIPVPKRKPVPPPQLFAHESGEEAEQRVERRPVPPPPLPKRRQPAADDRGDGEDMLVVAAPADSEPTTPLGLHDHSFMEPWTGAPDDGVSVTQLADAELTDPVESPTSGLVADTPPETFSDMVQDSDQATAEGQELAGGDEDEFSAWMDNPGPEELDVPGDIHDNAA